MKFRIPFGYNLVLFSLTNAPKSTLISKIDISPTSVLVSARDHQEGFFFRRDLLMFGRCGAAVLASLRMLLVFTPPPPPNNKQSDNKHETNRRANFETFWSWFVPTSCRFSPATLVASDTSLTLGGLFQFLKMYFQKIEDETPLVKSPSVWLILSKNYFGGGRAPHCRIRFLSDASKPAGTCIKPFFWGGGGGGSLGFGGMKVNQPR